ncbi:TetR/AcrR family transcriptional regulator [Chitinivorax sp. PXF-14]|uniref:TetR/AcrR family transcriptional regulator n=1 Tax=Chitinivorax sp. PXF-14 TaxID=3230488 RepID=UPI003467DCF3
MRYAPEYKATARAKLLETSGALAKKKGFGVTGVDALMAEAGLTSGAFYSHFKSKNELLSAIIENELARTSAMFDRPDTKSILKAIRGYLSAEHVASPETGCLIPTLGPEVARADAATRALFEQGITRMQSTLQQKMPHDGDAWAVISMAVGALVIARAMETPETQREALDAVAKHIEAIITAD